MDAGTLSIKTIFGQDRRHVVPLFQRPYVWKRDSQWEPLWEDVRGVGDRLLAKQPVRYHFLGAVVFDLLRKPTGHIEARLVIDGQQRLTTIQLLLEAFCDVCGSLGAERYHKALLKLTRNDDPMSESADDQFKVWPTTVDQDHFRRVMSAGSPEEVLEGYKVKLTATEVGHPIADGYLFFHSAIKEWIGTGPDAEERVEALYLALREYVRMVVIDLGRDDDAQLIFETLNARGTPLLPSDLVKNLLLQRADREGEHIEKLYEKYWKQFDSEPEYWRAELGRGHAKRARIDLFMQHFLTLQTGDEIPVAHLYASFREFAAETNGIKARDHLERLARYAAVYRCFDNAEPGSRVELFFRRLGAMDIMTAYPFLLELFAKCGVPSAPVEEVLGDLESFLVRRLICQLNTRGYNRLFIDLLPSLNGASAEVPGRVRSILLSSDAESSRWPSDAEFRSSWQTLPAYRVLVRGRVRMILEAVELQLFSELTEKVELKEKLTIEHLMPQEWSKHWPLPVDQAEEAAAERRENVIHKFGNLTLLTGKLNPSISNGPWERKLDKILDHGALALNRRLRGRHVWDEQAIELRGNELYELARVVWPKSPL